MALAKNRGASDKKSGAPTYNNAVRLPSAAKKKEKSTSGKTGKARNRQDPSYNPMQRQSPLHFLFLMKK